MHRHGLTGEPMPTAALQLATLFRLDPAGRLLSTLEPGNPPAPAFALIRDFRRSVWAVRHDVPAAEARQLAAWAGEEPPLGNLLDPPVHAEEYQGLVGGSVYAGPAYRFPLDLPPTPGVVQVGDRSGLLPHFAGEALDPSRQPVMAILQGGVAVAVCYSARWGAVAAEAGADTLPAARGQGLAPKVVAAWALAVRARGRVPLYSTDWSNVASQRVASKLGLIAYAADWSVAGDESPP